MKSIKWKMTNRTPSIPKTVSSAGAVSTNVRKSPSNSMKISRVWKAECARLLGPLPKASARRRTGREFGIKGRENLPSYAESHACVPCLRRSGFAQAGEAHFGAQARVFRPWMNAGRVPFEAPKERSRVCFGGFRPTKLVEGPRLRAVTHFGVQARALAHGAPHLTAETFFKHRNISCSRRL